MTFTPITSVETKKTGRSTPTLTLPGHFGTPCFPLWVAAFQTPPSTKPPRPKSMSKTMPIGSSFTSLATPKIGPPKTLMLRPTLSAEMAVIVLTSGTRKSLSISIPGIATTIHVPACCLSSVFAGMTILKCSSQTASTNIFMMMALSRWKTPF